MNTIIKRMLAFSLSLFLIIAPTIQQANAASSWSVTNAVSAGSRTIVSATKGGLKSAVNIAPTAGRLGLTLARGANYGALAYAIAKGLGAVDWVLDPANNRIIYNDPPTTKPIWFYYNGTQYYTGTMDSICNQVLALFGETKTKAPTLIKSNGKTVGATCYGYNPYSIDYGAPPTIEKYRPIPAIAADVIANAAAGHADSQAATRAAAIEMVVAGDFDADLMAGAVPINDERPLVPSVPVGGANNDDGMTGGDVGATAEAARKAADAARKAAQAAADVSTAAAEAARKAADDAKDVINSAVDQAIKDAAAAAAADAAKAAADAKAVSDAAAAAAAKAAADAAVKAQNAVDKAAADLAAAVASGNASAISAATAAKAAADSAKAAADAAKADAKDTKPFELPAFCSWAKPVCDAVDWLMKPAPDLGDDTTLDVDGSDVMPVDTDINFGGSCPANFEFNGSIFGNSINIVLLDTSKFCGFLSTFVKFPVYAASSLFALYILGGRKDV